MAWISIPFSSSTWRTPTCARPRAPPEERATPSRGRALSRNGRSLRRGCDACWKRLRMDPNMALGDCPERGCRFLSYLYGDGGLKANKSAGILLRQTVGPASLSGWVFAGAGTSLSIVRVPAFKAGGLILKALSGISRERAGVSAGGQGWPRRRRRRRFAPHDLILKTSMSSTSILDCHSCERIKTPS